jgi:AcrR family transcriptional regulator
VGSLTVEAVAARSGVAKTTIYRRWRDKWHLALDAVMIDQLPYFAEPGDVGDTRKELIAFVHGIITWLGGTPTGKAMQGLVSEIATSPELSEVYRSQVVEAARAAAPRHRAWDRARRPAAGHGHPSRPRAARRPGLLRPAAQRRPDQPQARHRAGGRRASRVRRDQPGRSLRTHQRSDQQQQQAHSAPRGTGLAARSSISRSSARRFARRASARRVRVLIVPRGIPSRVATSVWESPSK